VNHAKSVAISLAVVAKYVIFILVNVVHVQIAIQFNVNAAKNVILFLANAVLYVNLLNVLAVQIVKNHLANVVLYAI
jgi:hypothetical protein